MNRDLANEQVWQFTPLWFVVDATEFIAVTPFNAQTIKVGIVNGQMVIYGTYGIDIFPNHKFTLLVDGGIKEYYAVEDIPEHFDNVIKYEPDDTHDITFTYTFSKDGKEFNYTHWVHHDMIIWETFLPELMNRETNGGW